MVEMIPFLLYNMEPQDRVMMLQLMPPFVPVLLKLLRSHWQSMDPFLLVEQHTQTERQEE